MVQQYEAHTEVKGNKSTFETLTFLSALQPTNQAIYADCACFIVIYENMLGEF